MSSNPAMLGIITYGPAAARLGRASRAAVLAKRGASASTILRKTGYQRGVYGRGVETRGDAFLKPTATFGAKPAGTLAEVADVHPDVERAYPGVGSSLRVEVVPNNAWDERVEAARRALALWEANSTASAFYDRGNNLIAVRAQMPGESLSGYLDRADGSLVHELQHYAQHQDGLRPPRRHVDSHDYRVDGLEVEARNSAARRKLTPAERVEMPREMTQDVKPEDVRQAWRGGVPRNEITRVDAPAPARRMPEGTVPPVSVYDHPALDPSAKPPVLSLPTGSNPVARAVDAIPGRYVRNAVRGVVNGLGRAGETLLRIGGLVIDPSLERAADVLGAHIDENAYEYHDNGPSDQEVRIAPVVEGLVKYGVLAGGGGSARGVLPAAVAADARHDTLSELRDLGVPDSEAKFTADMNGLANGIIWGLPVGQAGGFMRRLATGSASLGARGYLSARADTAAVDSVVDLEAMSGAERAAYEAENRAREAESALLTAGFAPFAAVSGPGRRRLPASRDVPLRLTNRDEKGGDNFGTFRNFLATDDVPESIFGIPVVQDKSQYTEKDLKFFRENPKAAGFYDLGDEDVEEDVPQQAMGAGVPFLAMSIGPVGAATYKKNTGKDLGDLEKAQSMKKGWFESQKGFELRRKRETGWEFEGGKWKYETPYDPSLKYGVVETPRVGDVKKRLEDVLDFSRVPEYLLAYPDVKNVPVVLAGRGKTESMKEDGLSGYYSTGKKTITIRTDRGYNNTTKAAIHEVGHPVYQMEHGVPTDLHTRNRSDHEYLHSDDEVESRILEARHDLTPEQRMNTRIADSADVPAEKRIGAPNKANQDAKGGKTRGKYPGASNNPGNVERHENRTNKTLFEGEDGGGARPKRFARFTDPVLGLKAAATVLARHADSLAKAGKPLTIENYAPIYAPKGENNTEEYIKNVSAYSGIARDATIDRWDTETLAKLLKAKVRFETSPEASQWFTDEEYKEAAEKLQEGAVD